MAKYQIHESNWSNFTKKINMVMRKASKYGCEFQYQELGEEFKMTSHGHREYDEYNHCEVYVEDFKSHDKYYIVDVEGKSVIEGWDLVASVDYTTTKNGVENIIFQLGDIEVPEKYFNADCFCEHCKTRRIRKNTYIVRNQQSGEFKQIGKSCLRDYTWGLDGEAIARSLQFLKEAETWNEPMFGWTASTTYFEIEEILQYIAECVKKFGYATKDSGRCTTAHQAEMIYYYQHKDNRPRWFNDDDVKKCETWLQDTSFNHENTVGYVTDGLNWIESKEENGNAWLHNLKVLCHKEYVDSSDLPLLASLFSAYDKNVKAIEERKAKEEAKANLQESSKYIGTVGERRVFHIDEITCLCSRMTQYGTMSYFYQLIDTEGNVLMWSGSKSINESNADKYEFVKATIKDHREYNGIKQTYVTRVSPSK